MDSEREKKANQPFQKVIFILLLLFSIHFWDLKYVPQMFNLENLIVWSASAFAFIMVIIQGKRMLFTPAIIIFFVGLLLNSLAAYLNLNQSPYKTLLAYSYYYFILMYFLLHYFEFSRKFLENTILAFGIIYALIFTIQYAIYPTTILNRDPNRAYYEIQLEIIGHGFLMLSYFLLLNRFLVNRKIINAITAVIFFVILFKSGFRTLVGGALIVSAIMYLRMFSFKIGDIAIVAFVALAIIVLLQFKGISDTIDQMIGKTQTEIELGEKFNRLLDIEFFFKEYPKNFSYFVIGGGKATGENLYIFDEYALGQNYNIVWVDIGILGFYIVIGGIATLGLLIYVFKAIFAKVPRYMVYLNFYFLYLLIVSFTNEEIYRNGIFCVHAIGLYLIDSAVMEHKYVPDGDDKSH